MHNPNTDPNRDFKLGLQIAASGAIALSPLTLPAHTAARVIPASVAMCGSLHAIAKANVYEHQDRIEADARERWQALKADMDDSLLISSQAFYTANPAAYIQGREVPAQWHHEYLNARFSPLPELAPAPTQEFQPIAQPQPQRHEQGVRGGSFDPSHGFTPQHPQAQEPIPAVPTLSAYQPPATSSIATKEYTPALFDWHLFQRDPDRLAHAVVLGSTGDGKTSLQEWLARLLAQGNELIVLTTKKKGMQWDGLPVTGLGRDFHPISTEWQKVESALNQRCGNLDLAQSQPQIICAIDELNDVIANSSVDLANVARAGREARVRLIVNSHSEGVDGLGLKGKNDIKHCFSWIRLGQFAVNYARSLANKNLLNRNDLAWIESQDRPCMVNDSIAKVPTLPLGWQSHLLGSPATPQAHQTQNPEPPSMPSVEPGFGEMVHSSYLPVQSDEPANTALSHEPEPSADRESELLAKFAEFKALGMNKAQICFALWQAKKGGTDRYRMASNFYDRLNSKYLEINGSDAA